MNKIGLIAGNRQFPLLFSAAAKKNNYYVVAIAIKGDTSTCISRYADKVYWLGLREFGRIFDIFKQEGITKVIMAGQISPRRLFTKEVEGDSELKVLLDSLKDKKADTIFGAVAGKLKDNGLELMDSTIFIKDLLSAKGVLTGIEPGTELWQDINFGLELAKAAAGLDIGQTVAVKDKAVVAVEALEGTDSLIRRAGKVARGGFTLVKVSKPNQDMRFDVPVVGLNTIKNLAKAGGRCLAIEAGKTLFLDREKALLLARKKGIFIVAV